MPVELDIPDDMLALLSRRLPGPLEREVLEAAAVEWYRQGRLLHGQFSRLLSVSRYEADGILKRHGVVRDMGPDELSQDIDAAMDTKNG
jgi:predicted HTH domain antitoxin